jgi:hypothetical protein
LHGRIFGQQRREPHRRQAVLRHHRGGERPERLPDHQRRAAGGGGQLLDGRLDLRRHHAELLADASVIAELPGEDLHEGTAPPGGEGGIQQQRDLGAVVPAWRQYNGPA